ncbi:MAG TPA: hypothetical protein DDZ96_04155 [Porphyromonadaceae bacterium]|nr:hypothetical protein [Porphyromonadaceae bacterium]HBK31923.1 hypothetical protein [Porphyromonadaceae bacterium]HBL32998.1 hypothetical protein [Porphyromonadaceae bacterium]HBX21991.1 hypothetical protein [Porphyromonadaceae bacterium]HBX44574.1 hypothetical protein [Porphyromonadaceae bacterium]
METFFKISLCCIIILCSSCRSLKKEPVSMKEQGIPEEVVFGEVPDSASYREFFSPSDIKIEKEAGRCSFGFFPSPRVYYVDMNSENFQEGFKLLRYAEEKKRALDGWVQEKNGRLQVLTLKVSDENRQKKCREFWASGRKVEF